MYYIVFVETPDGVEVPSGHAFGTFSWGDASAFNASIGLRGEIIPILPPSSHGTIYDPKNDEILEPLVKLNLQCAGCQKTPDQFPEYVSAAADEASTPGYEEFTAGDYVWREEGTLNRATGKFLCDSCYIRAGQPVGENRTRWTVPEDYVFVATHADPFANLGSFREIEGEFP